MVEEKKTVKRGDFKEIVKNHFENHHCYYCGSNLVSKKDLEEHIQ